MLADNRSVDGCRVCLVTDGSEVLLLALSSVSVGVLLWDILADMSGDLGSDVLVVRVLFLLVAVRNETGVSYLLHVYLGFACLHNGLDLLVDFSLLLLAVNNGCDLVVSVLLDILV